MACFRCLARGENFLLNYDGGLRLMGFYATRWVEADNEKDAEIAALALLKSERIFADMPDAQRHSNAQVYFEEVEPVVERPANALNEGFIFFPMTPDDDAD